MDVNITTLQIQNKKALCFLAVCLLPRYRHLKVYSRIELRRDVLQSLEHGDRTSSVFAILVA